MHQLFDIRNEESLTYDKHGFAQLFGCAEASVEFGRLLPGESGVDPHSADDREDVSLVLSGMLSYPTAAGSEMFVAKGSWVVARPGETFGYCNRGGKPVTLFRFRPKSAKRSPAGQRICKPAEPRPGVTQQRILAYETPVSRGEILMLHPGEPAAFQASFCCATLVTSGRVMALFGREKVSLESGEGLGFVGERGELVGVGGLAQVALVTTAV